MGAMTPKEEAGWVKLMSLPPALGATCLKPSPTRHPWSP